MMHSIRNGLPVCLIGLCLLTGMISGQAFSQNAAGSGVEAIKAAYNQFRYAEVISLSLQSLAATPPPSLSEKVEIYTYLAFARVSLGQNEMARKDFEAALELDPTLTLDPVYVSPKIINLFNEVKLKMRAERPQRQAELQVSDTCDVWRGAAWRSLVLPGWGQWHKNQKGKAAAILAVQTVQISALLFSHARMNEHHDRYLEARDPADIEAAYRKYNMYSKRRSYLAISTVAVWLYAHIDAALSPPSKPGAKDTGTSVLLEPQASGDLAGCRYVIYF